jgi:fumarate reductase flavoprotein subunit
MEEENTKKDLSRRGFIKGAAIGAGAIAVTGMAGIQDASAAPVPKKWDKEADVVIIGAGGAGLMAGIEAKAAGAKVLVIDKTPTVFSTSSAISGGQFAAPASKVQKSNGISDDSPDKFYRDMMKYGEYMSEAGLVKLLANNCASVIDFLVDNGLSLIVKQVAGHSINRVHQGKNSIGKDYVDIAWKVFQDRKIPIEFNTAATKLIYDPNKKMVVGIEAVKGRRKLAIRAKRAVVLASGGYTDDAKMFDRLIPALAGQGVLIGGAGNKGEGMKMAVRDVGAFPTHLQYSATYPFGMEMGPRSGSCCMYYYFLPNGAIMVNKEGKRFADEGIGMTKLSVEVSRQTEKANFLIMDSTAWEETMAKHKLFVIFKMPVMSPEEVQQEFKKEKVLIKADSVDMLASKANINAASLAATINKFNEYVKSGNDPEFKRSKKTLAKEIVMPPFYAVKMTLWTCLGLGGIRVNDKLQVTDAYDAVVPGLYAAGEVVGGVFGASYMTGTAMSWAFTSGYLAGKYAADEKG